MKIKLIISDNNRSAIEQKLTEAGFEVCDEAQFTLIEENVILDKVIAKTGNMYTIVSSNQIIFIESYNHDIFVHTKTNKYKIKEKLYELEKLLDQTKFIRINQSTIVNVDMIIHISSTLGLKYNLKLMSGQQVHVTRTYYYRFKEFIGI